jgi:putative transposase
LKDYDYSQMGEYLITLVTHKHKQLFGEIVDSEMRLNPIGQIIRVEWVKSATIRHEIELGEFIIMPNHFHAIVHILDTDTENITGDSNGIGRGDRPVAPTTRPRLTPKSLGALVAGFKSSTTTLINEYRNTPGIPVWQRNYYEHIICSDNEYLRIDAYISCNPENWPSDPENPVHIV